MRNIFRRIVIVLLCLLFCMASVCAQTTGKETDSVSEIEKSYVIPQSQTGFTDSDTGTESSFWLFFRMILVLAVICVIIWFVGRLIKKRMDPGAEPDLYLKKTAQLTLAPGRTIQIVTLRDRAYVLGVTDSGISVIDKIDSTESKDKALDKELIDDMNLRAAENLNAKPKDFASMISSLSSSSKRTEDFLKNRRMNFKNNGERK